MSSAKNQFFGLFFGSLPPVIALAGLLLAGSAPARAQNEKRTVFKESDFHWQGNLKPGYTLEIIGRNGGIDATGTTGEAAQVEGIKQTNGDANEVFVEMVEYSDGVTICAVYERDAQPGRCHRGGVDSDHHGWSWHNNRTKLNFNLKVPRGVLLKATTTNGGIRCRDLNSIVEASTTNANGSVRLSLPASAEFKVRAATTNGGIHTDFPVTVVGSFGSKDLSGTVGAGGRDLRLATTNGGIELRKSGS